MSNSISQFLLWIVVLFNLILTLAIVRRMNHSQAEPIETLKIGQPAPDFLAHSLAGTSFSLSSFEERDLILVFISPDCGFCRDMLPDLETIKTEALKHNTEIILISDSTSLKTQDFVNETEITLPILVAPREENDLFLKYKIGGVPFYTIVDFQKNIQAAGIVKDRNWIALTDAWIKGG